MCNVGVRGAGYCFLPDHASMSQCRRLLTSMYLNTTMINTAVTMVDRVQQMQLKQGNML